MDTAVSAEDMAQLETELTAAKAECDLNRTRLASIFWSGAMDNYTGGDVQKWAANYTAELARLRAEVERLNGCCEELHTIIDTTAIHRAPIYAKMKARAEKAEAECVKWRRLLHMSRDDREQDLEAELAAIKKVTK